MPLSAAQQDQVDRWFPGADVVADLSWGLVDTVVLHLRTSVADVVIKGAGPDNGHIPREIGAHTRWTSPWLVTGSVGRMLHAEADLSLVAIEHLPGRLAQDVAPSADVHRQAGALLRTFHDQARQVDDAYEAEADDRALAWLERPHRIPAPTVEAARAAIAGHEHPPVEMVPTHGDWQERNWLVDDAGTVRVIDLGRAAWRPRWTDLVRLARREWVARPSDEDAFLEGYGYDPRPRDLWRATLLREAISCAAWAYSVGDEPFEAEGLRSLDSALATYP